MAKITIKIHTYMLIILNDLLFRDKCTNKHFLKKEKKVKEINTNLCADHLNFK